MTSASDSIKKAVLHRFFFDLPRLYSVSGRQLIMRFVILSLAAGSFISCGQKPATKSRLITNTGYAQGTTYQVKYISPEGTNFASEIEELFEAIDYSMSTYRNNSLIEKVNQGGEWVEVDSLFLAVLSRSLEIAEETAGDFDPTVGPLTKLWGFTYEALDKTVTSKDISPVLEKTGYTHVKVDGNRVYLPEGFEIDFNAIAPGYTADVIAAMLERNKVENYMAEIGGEIRSRGHNDKGNIWRIGVDKPETNLGNEQERFQFILELKDAGLATSGSYRRFWVDEETGVKYAHTINPHTGYPARNTLVSATIIAPEAIDADAYATVCMVKGLEECKAFLTNKPELEAYLIYSLEDDTTSWGEYLTEGFKKYLTEEFMPQKD